MRTPLPTHLRRRHRIREAFAPPRAHAPGHHSPHTCPVTLPQLRHEVPRPGSGTGAGAASTMAPPEGAPNPPTPRPGPGRAAPAPPPTAPSAPRPSEPGPSGADTRRAGMGVTREGGRWATLRLYPRELPSCGGRSGKDTTSDSKAMCPEADSGSPAPTSGPRGPAAVRASIAALGGGRPQRLGGPPRPPRRVAEPLLGSRLP